MAMGCLRRRHCFACLHADRLLLYVAVEGISYWTVEYTAICISSGPVSLVLPRLQTVTAASLLMLFNINYEFLVCK